MAVFRVAVNCSLVEADSTLKMEAVSTSQTSLYFYGTIWHNISEDCHCQLATMRNWNLMSSFVISDLRQMLLWLSHGVEWVVAVSLATHKVGGMRHVVTIDCWKLTSAMLETSPMAYRPHQIAWKTINFRKLEEVNRQTLSWSQKTIMFQNGDEKTNRASNPGTSRYRHRALIALTSFQRYFTVRKCDECVKYIISLNVARS